MAIITFDRPEAMNALDPARNEALTRAFERLEREDSARRRSGRRRRRRIQLWRRLRKLIPLFRDACGRPLAALISSR
jgi:hypothetical protein